MTGGPNKDHLNVAGELGSRTDLYRGTAPFYDHYRPPYPAELLGFGCTR